MADETSLETPQTRERRETTPEAEAQAFLDELRWEKLIHDEGEAKRMAGRVLCELERRLSEGTGTRIIDSLPVGVQDLLVGCARLEGSPARRESKRVFVADVSDDLNVNTGEGERIIRAVFAAVREHLTEDDIESVSNQLPPDLADLWRRPA